MGTIISGDKIVQSKYVAFFDLDHTLTNSISGKALAIGAYRKKWLSSFDLLNAIWLSLLFRLRLRDELEIINSMVSWVKNIPERDYIELCLEIFNDEILPSTFKEARAEIEIHRANKARLVILSSALKPICEAMSTDLKIDDILCSDLEVKNGFMTGRPLGQLCFAEEKAKRLISYCIANGFTQSEAWYYGDSISDLPALKVVGNPVCVNPDNKLKRKATGYGWPIRLWKTS